MQESDEYLRSGASGIIAKPFEPGGLVKQVRAYTGELEPA
jgi:hypothetical protein